MKDIAEIIQEAVSARETRTRQGKVVSIQAGPPRTVTVDISGTSYPGIRTMDNVEPVVGEGVWILDMGIGRWLISGTNSSAQTRSLYVKSAGDGMTGRLDLTVAASEALRFIGDASFISFYNAGSANRRGYLQGNTGGLILSSEAGILVLAGSGGVTIGSMNFNGTTISYGSYITIPGGLYVSGVALYSAAPIQCRGGIGNDSGTFTLAGGSNGQTYWSGGYALAATTANVRIEYTTGQMIVNNSRRSGKKSIASSPDVGDLIDRLRPVTFISRGILSNGEWQEETPEQTSRREAEVHRGFISEEVAAVNPHLADWGFEDGVLVPFMWKTNDFISMCIKELQSVRQRIKTLENK